MATAVCLVTVAVMAAYTFSRQRVYASTLTVRVQQTANAIPDAPSLQPQYDYRVDPLASEQQVIKSRTIAERAVGAAGLRLEVTRPARTLVSQVLGENVPVVRDDARAGIDSLRWDAGAYTLRAAGVSYGPARFGDTLTAAGVSIVVPRAPRVSAREVELRIQSLDAATRDLRTRIDTRVLPQTDIIELTIVGPDPVRDRDAANAVARVYAEYAREQAQRRAHGRSEYIAQSLSEQAAATARSQDSLRSFQERHQTSDVTDEQTELFKRIYKFASDRSELMLEQRVYLALVGKLASVDTTDNELRKLAGTDAIAHNKGVATLYESWIDLEGRRQRLMLSKTERNLDVQGLDSTIASTKRSLQLASELYLKSLDTRIASLDSNVAELRQQTERYPPMVAEQARLAANVKTRETGYNSLLSQYQLARISEGGETGSVRIIDAAVTPLEPVWPDRGRALVLAALLGLLLAVVSSVAMDRIDDSVRTAEEVRDALQLPILGSVPRVAGAALFSRGASVRLRAIAHTEPQSVAAEAFRSVRTNLVFARAHKDLRTVVITSAAPADGKSTAATNLATTFAQQGQRTVLIDADLRRSALDGVFGIPRDPGLSDVLVGRARLAEVARSVDVPNLAVVPSGPPPPNPSELLGSPAMRLVLEEAKALFDMVIIDSPPVLAVTDAAVLASLVDGTIVVVRMGESRREAVRRAVGQLRVVNGHVIGAVLNDVDASRDPYYGGYGYYSQAR